MLNNKWCCVVLVPFLLVCERGDGVAADLHEAAALPQPGLPGVAKVLHLGDQAVVLDMESQLAQLIPPEKQYCC